jgi:hypothetical protein
MFENFKLLGLIAKHGQKLLAARAECYQYLFKSY